MSIAQAGHEGHASSHACNVLPSVPGTHTALQEVPAVLSPVTYNIQDLAL